jgi:nitrate/nitrite transport system substrate-binding protein
MISPKPVLAKLTPQSRRRQTLKAAITVSGGSAVALLDPLMRSYAWAQGSDAPEKKEVKIGFIPLTDCASVVMASVMGFDQKYGVKIVPNKEASWASVRDKLVNGELDFAHVLYGMMYGLQTGSGGRVDEPQQQRASNYALQKDCRQGCG